MDAVNKMIGFYKKAVLENYYNFNGRATLPEYWWFVLANVIVAFVIGIVDGILASVIGIAILGTIYSLAVLLPSLGVAARRLHDTGKSGWNLLWTLIPLLGAIYVIYLLVQKGETGKNAFGEPVKK
ncbi:MAG: DUF805 domain-containing protein [Lactobacillaceae bacterium]|jgi:uncharacterized membrane protein YhaH (DUF805 family)|nr:DUF805 domain-containing protein [Lactobacillaceae bacterium]